MKNKISLYLLATFLFAIVALLLKIPPVVISKVVLLGLFLSLIQVQDLCQHCYKLSFLFFLIVFTLKLIQYEFYISTGFDLGIFSNILFNISHHGKIFDGLNQVHGFSGHIWPGAFLIAPSMILWNDPRVLLLIQTIAISMIFPVTCMLVRQMKIERKYVNSLLIILIFNIYLHWVSAFDFHPETITMPMLLLGIWMLNEGRFGILYLLMLISMSFKEDVFLAWLSLGVYFLLIGRKKEGIKIVLPSVLYSIIVVFLILKFVNIKMMMSLHYSGNFNILKRIKPTLEFFTSFGFLPVVSVKEIPVYFIPFLEHISSSRPLHYKLKCQYSALLIPLVTYASLKVLNGRKISRKTLLFFTTIAVLFSINEGPVKKYINFSRLNLRKKIYLDTLIKEIPDNMKLSVGNHISPHLSTRDGVYQFPIIKDAEMIIVDTTWHDFTPVSLDSGLKTLSKVISSGKFKLVSDSMGVMVLMR